LLPRESLSKSITIPARYTHDDPQYFWLAWCARHRCPSAPALPGPTPISPLARFDTEHCFNRGCRRTPTQRRQCNSVARLRQARAHPTVATSDHSALPWACHHGATPARARHANWPSTPQPPVRERYEASINKTCTVGRVDSCGTVADPSRIVADVQQQIAKRRLELRWRTMRRRRVRDSARQCEASAIMF
jgi:hypothetical protein